MGAAEVSGFDVKAGATIDIRGYGLGENSPEGNADYVITAVGFNF